MTREDTIYCCLKCADSTNCCAACGECSECCIECNKIPLKNICQSSAYLGPDGFYGSFRQTISSELNGLAFNGLDTVYEAKFRMNSFYNDGDKECTYSSVGESKTSQDDGDWRFSSSNCNDKQCSSYSCRNGVCSAGKYRCAISTDPDSDCQISYIDAPCGPSSSPTAGCPDYVTSCHGTECGFCDLYDETLCTSTMNGRHSNNITFSNKLNLYNNKGESVNVAELGTYNPCNPIVSVQAPPCHFFSSLVLSSI